MMKKHGNEAVRAKKHGNLQITFEVPSQQDDAPTLTITGLPMEHINRPERILKLMDLLELPEGTNARIVYSAEDVIVR
jgi:hypothetical protein